MSTIDQKILDSLFRDIVKFYSSSQTSLITLRAMIKAVKFLECEDDMFRVQIMEVCKTITNSQPRMVPIDNLIILLEHELSRLGGNYYEMNTKVSLPETLFSQNHRIARDSHIIYRPIPHIRVQFALLNTLEIEFNMIPQLSHLFNIL